MYCASSPELFKARNRIQELKAWSTLLDCSMYHIWTAQCQTQLFSVKEPDRRRYRGCPVRSGELEPIEFAATVRGRILGMQQRHATVPHSLRYLIKSANDKPGLVCKAQTLRRGPLEQVIDLFRQIVRRPGRALERPGKHAG